MVLDVHTASSHISRYFKAWNGTYKRVGQVPNRFLNGEKGGMTVYYTSPYDGSKVTAFKPVRPAPPELLMTASAYL
jgi:hypothetical protein